MVRALSLAMVPNLDDPAWVTITAPLLAELGTARTIEWIRNWIRGRKKVRRSSAGSIGTDAISSETANMLAYLSIKGLATACYDGEERTHWVVIGNVPSGWLTYKETGDAIVKTDKKAPTYETVSMAE